MIGEWPINIVTYTNRICINYLCKQYNRPNLDLLILTVPFLLFKYVNKNGVVKFIYIYFNTLCYNWI